jgi:hypothetical protein
MTENPPGGLGCWSPHTSSDAIDSMTTGGAFGESAYRRVAEPDWNLNFWQLSLEDQSCAMAALTRSGALMEVPDRPLPDPARANLARGGQHQLICLSALAIVRTG